jgi:hypothetical protein
MNVCRASVLCIGRDPRLLETRRGRFDLLAVSQLAALTMWSDFSRISIDHNQSQKEVNGSGTVITETRPM